MKPTKASLQERKEALGQPTPPKPSKECLEIVAKYRAAQAKTNQLSQPKSDESPKEKPVPRLENKPVKENLTEKQLATMRVDDWTESLQTMAKWK
jgi:hypothetical protein